MADAVHLSASKIINNTLITRHSDERGQKRRVAYGYLKNHFKITCFLMESGHKLSLPPVAISTACVLYHRFWRTCSVKDFDIYLIATTALYLASKAEEAPCKLRDVINVCYRTTHPNSASLEVGARFWELRDSVVNCELLLLRELAFKVIYNNPHKYLLHYLKSLEDWVEPDGWDRSHVGQLSWSILRDSHHITVCLDHPPSHVAIAVLHFSLLCVGLEVPSHGGTKPWWKILCSGVSESDLQSITEDIMDLYDYENKPL